MIKLLELFGGIGACSKALEKLGIDYEIADYVEIDKYAVKSFNAMHNTNFEPQDICEWDKDIDVDLIMHGSPCQDFSLSGLQAGGDEGSGTRSSLMYETLRIVEKTKPKYVIWENVKNLISKKHIHNFNNYIERMNKLGYTSYYQVLNAKDYGIPQNRERVFTISIRLNQYFKQGSYWFPQPQELKLKLKDMLEDNVDEKYYLSDKMIQYISADNEKWIGNNKESLINKAIASTINTGEGSKRCDVSNYVSEQVGENYNIKIKNATKQGYLIAEEGDGIDISSRQNYHRGTVQKESTQTLDTQCNVRVVVKNMKQELCDELIKDGKVKENDMIRHSYTTWRKEKEFRTENSQNNNISATLTTRPDTLGVTVNQPPLRIRKLTPKECWRLMGFDDSDFEKAERVNSNTQLYKQAGNSIVVNVMEAILNNLLGGE